jgi:acyl-CoA thioester hydrolase
MKVKKRIYYYDTDCGGVVYYGNYLKFLEEARTEYFEEKGLSVKDMMDNGILFVVKKQEIEYKYPAFYGDVLEIKTKVAEISGVRIRFEYEIFNQNNKLISKAVTDMICVDRNLKLMEMPYEVCEKLLGTIKKESA